MKYEKTISRRPFSQSADFELTRKQSKTGGIIQGNGWALDISFKGLGSISDIPLAAGEIIRLNLPSHPDGISIPVFSVVRWAKSEDNGYKVTVLIKFRFRIRGNGGVKAFSGCTIFIADAGPKLGG